MLRQNFIIFSSTFKSVQLFGIVKLNLGLP